MKRKASIMLFGLSFIVAILGEAYLLSVSKHHMFSIVGIGIVVILTGSLFFDSIWEHVSTLSKQKEILLEESKRQDAEKWDNRYTELLNIQKATYSALKKSEIRLQEEIRVISERQIHIIQLQNKVMDGQSKALNISLNYSREYTKELIDAIKEECKNINYEEQLTSILSLLQSHQVSLENDDTIDKYEKVSSGTEQEITPLYDDPNKALTADEIARLFENYGK